jgi:hypothetical protein
MATTNATTRADATLASENPRELELGMEGEDGS